MGYRFGASGCGMRASVVLRIKQRIAYIIYANLLEPLKLGHVVPARVAPAVDRDYWAWMHR